MNSKYRFTILVVIALAALCGSCRKDADDIPNPDLGVLTGYLTYEGQFLAVWHGINSSYVHWSADTVDWDARYRRLLPKFQHLDSMLLDDNVADEDRCVPYEAFSALYTELLQGLIDHHMTVYIKNLAPAPGDDQQVFAYMPGLEEVKSRDYYHGRVGIEAGMKALRQMEQAGQMSELQYESSNDGFAIVSGLIEGRYAYLRMSGYELSAFVDEQDPATQNGRLAAVYRHWMELCSRPSTQGIILDNRGNTGGYATDLQYVVAPFIAEDIVPAYCRTKNGLHRLDYTPWAPMTIHKAAETRTDIPYLVLADVWSVSMGEITTAAIKSLPNGYFIGERTFGGHGPLSGNFSRTFAGTFGSMDDYHYVYTTTYQTKFVDGGILEGYGIVPDTEVLLDLNDLSANYRDNQLEAGLAYLRTTSNR